MDLFVIHIKHDQTYGLFIISRQTNSSKIYRFWKKNLTAHHVCDAHIVACWLYTLLYCVFGVASLSPASETACGGWWWWLSGCLDGLDKDIKGTQKAALWRGHIHGRTSLFFQYQWGSVSRAICPAGRLGEVLVCWLWIWHRFVLLIICMIASFVLILFMNMVEYYFFVCFHNTNFKIVKVFQTILCGHGNQETSVLCQKSLIFTDWFKFFSVLFMFTFILDFIGLHCKCSFHFKAIFFLI